MDDLIRNTKTAPRRPGAEGTLVGIATATAFVALPTAIWIMSHPPTATAFSDWMRAASYLGKTVSVPGAALFCLALLLSARIPLFERIFGDISASYRVHQWIGGLALILLSAHPIGIAIGYLAFSPIAAARFLLPISGTEKTIGIAALLLLQASIALTYWNRIPYHLWKLAHKILGFACLLGIVHALTINGAISDMPALKAILATYLTLGIGAWTYRSVAGRWLVPRRTYRIERVALLNQRCVELDLVPEGKAIAPVPGRFAFVTVLDPAVPREEHPFSIARIGDGGRISFMAKDLGDFTSKLKRVKPGSIALIEGPYGRFGSEAGGPNQVWIAGGVGITPFVGMAETMPDAISADLIYSFSSHDDSVALDVLRGVTARNPRFRLHEWPSSEKGRLTADTILEMSGGSANKDFFICGPGIMVRSIRKNLLAKGVLSGSIHEESFNFR